MAAADKDGDVDLGSATKPTTQEVLATSKLPTMRVLEEDDEFEEFEDESWSASAATKDDEKLWQDDWDDDEIDNDFCSQLRAQLTSTGVLGGGAAAESKA